MNMMLRSPYSLRNCDATSCVKLALSMIGKDIRENEKIIGKIEDAKVKVEVKEGDIQYSIWGVVNDNRY